MREFTTAATEAGKTEGEKAAPMVFKVDGRECRAFKPKDGQLAMLMASTGRHAGQNEQVAGLINFFVSVCDKPTHAYLVDRLLDYEDDFGIEQVQDIMEWMVEEWSGNPTPALSVSTR